MEKVLLKKYKEMDETERKRLKELLRDKDKSEGNVEKIGWLYKPDKPDSEEYLLGKRIDKNVDRELEKETLNEDAPGALFTEVVSRRAEMDMMVKMREDPLYAIRRQEEEQRQKVLNNPVKMKRLMKEIEEKNENMKKEKKKKEKKSRKKKHASDSSSEESGDELLRKYLAIVEMKKNKDKKSHHEGERDKHSDRRVKGLTSESGRDRHERIDREDSRQRRRKHSGDNSERRKDSSKHHHASDEEDDDERPPSKYKQYGLNKTKVDRSPEAKRRRRSEDRDRPSRSSPPADKRKTEHQMPPAKRKLTSEEMERKRAEMMENARLCDEEREENVKRYKEEDARNERKMNHGKREGAKFIKPMLLKHTEKSSVEDRIKRNVYNIQRTASDLDKDFTKR